MTITADPADRLGAPEAAVPALPRRLPWRLLLVGVVTLGAVGVLAGAGLQGSVVYYKTTSELVADPSLHGQRLRLGGLVQPSSVQFDGAGVSFVLSDGVQDVPVVNTGQPRGVFQEGQGALVEGVWDADGVFRSDLLLVKHSNEYRAPESGLPERPAPDDRS